MDFIAGNDLSDVQNNPELKKKGDMLLSIVHNAAAKAVQNRAEPKYDDDYNLIEPETSPEETAVMKDDQTMLKLARNALAKAMGHKYRYGGRSSSIGDMMRDADPTGAKQRAGMQPRDISQKYADTLTDPQFDLQQIRRMRKK